jgi:GrpB-like predicted nucleotidyltransferase (UPF0157 family)/polyisoprenoid-binding protein YceI
MNTLCERSEPSVAAIDQPHPNLTGTWTIDPAASSASFTWRNLRLWTMTGRLHCVGVVHLDAPPPVGVAQFKQPSGLPVLTMALDPASVQTHDADLDARLRSPEVFDVLRHRWWLLRSDSLEVLPSGAWRVMATLTAKGTAGAIELRFEVDPAASSPTWLVLRGRGLLDRRAFDIARAVSTCSRQIRLDLAVRARRVGAHNHSTNRPTEVATPVPMHRLAARTDPHPPDAGIRSPSTPPIGRYRRVPVQVHQADPDAPEAARRLIALIATRWPATPAEHVGSSAVPGLAGKGIIDLLLAAPPAHIPAITQALLELGFQPQRPAAFPPTRPMLWGAFGHRASEYRVHVHVVPASSPEVAAMRGFRDALRADPRLRDGYAALKRAIVSGGPVDPVAFTKAKHDWIAATLAHLGLADDPPRRLYQDDPDPDGATGARRPPTARQDPRPWSSRTTARNEGVPVPMQPIHRLAHLAQQSDGGTEWAYPQCGRYLVRYPDSELVVAAGAPGPVHVLGSRYRDDPTEVPTVSEFDQQFLHRHAMAWSADHRPD